MIKPLEKKHATLLEVSDHMSSENPTRGLANVLSTETVVSKYENLLIGQLKV